MSVAGIAEFLQSLTLLGLAVCVILNSRAILRLTKAMRDLADRHRRGER